MGKRLFIIALVFAFATLLAFLQNKVMVGDQEFHPTVRQLGPQRYEVVLKDLAGNVVDAVQEDVDDLKHRMAAHGEVKRLPIDHIELSEDKTLVFDVSSQQFDLAKVRARVVEHPFKRPNPAKELFYLQRGIDLRGGVEFNCTLYDDDGAQVSATDEVVAILRSRLDARGLSEPQVYRLANGDVQVVIPGGTRADAARTRKVLESTGKLEFREVMARPNPQTGRVEANIFSNEPGTYIQQAGSRYVFTDKARQDGIILYSREDVIMPQKPPRGAEPTTFYHLGPPKLTGQDVDNAFETMHEGSIAVGITFSVPGGAKNHQFTKDIKHRGPDGEGRGSGLMAISLDGMVESAPRIIEPSNRNCVISGSFTTEEVNSLRTVLKAGSLAVKPEITSQRVVGATLGHDTIVKSLVAMVGALTAVLASIVLYYWWRLGTVAVLSLVSCLALIVVVISAFGATLTLPGLAGLVLTVGMAVDANILIFERIREEIGEDVDVKTCVHAGYSRAFLTIFDANITTFLTAFVLYLIGSGPVKGFGLTLMIGIVTSMFGALYVGRLVTDYLYRRQSDIHVAHRVPLPKVSYLGMRFVAFVLSGVIIIGGLGYFGFGGPVNRNFDIDFTGGNMTQVSFNEPLTLEAVQEVLAKAHASGTEGTHLLDPTSMQVQPYFSGFAGAGGATRQFVFKVRDEEASAIEKQKAALEAEANALRRQLEDIDPENPDRERIRTIEKEVAAVTEKIAPLKEELAQRVEVFKHQLEAAFAGKINQPGSELLASTWADGQLTIDLETIDEPESSTVTQVELALHAEPMYSDVHVEAKGSGLHVRLALSDEALLPPDIRLENEISERALGIFTAADLQADLAETLALRTKELVNRVDTAAASVGLQIAAPFPASDYFSPQVAEQMKWRALAAIGGSIIVILFYIAMRFELRYGVGAIMALVHDVLGTIGLLAVFGVRIDLTVVAAVLTIIGYSLNDTIVVFDRIRENRGLMGGSMKNVIDLSINQTMSRTILTSSTTIFSVVVLLLFGGDGVFSFSATMLIGLLLGTYSSVFIAAPTLLFFPDKPLESDDLEAEAAAQQPSVEAVSQALLETTEQVGGDKNAG